MSKNYININNKYDRVIVLVDMDCFYCQVEEKLNPEIQGKPIAVVQYNPWQGGGIIAVNYPARAKGVTRHMRGDEAKQHCPDIVLQQVPQIRGKADISKYRDAGKDVAAVLQTFTPLLERASVDEAYLDITERVLTRLSDMNEGKFQLLPDVLSNTFAVGYDSVVQFVHNLSGNLNGTNISQEVDSEEDRVTYKKSDIKLLVGASIVNEIRAAVKERTGYECSAGIAHNKILAKLTAGFNKPNKQTILPLRSIPKMYETLSIKRVKGLGGKLGEQVCALLKIEYMSELKKISEKTLQTYFDERLGSWMFLMARGIDLEVVTPKFNSKSIGCCKRFPGKNSITGLATLKHWLKELATEIQDRLEKDMIENNRTARQMTVSYSQQIKDTDVSSTRSVTLLSYDAERIAADGLDAIKRNTEIFLKADGSGALNNPIKFLGISAGKFDNYCATKKNDLKEMFSNITNKAVNNKQTEISSTEPLESKDIKRFFSSTADKTDRLPDVTVPIEKTCEESNTLNCKKNTVGASEQNHDPMAPLELIIPAPCDLVENSYSNDTLPLVDDQVEPIPPQPTSTTGFNRDMEISMEGTNHVKSIASLKVEVEINSMDQNLLLGDDKPATSSVVNKDYRLTYAEFQTPVAIIPADDHEPCSECGKNISIGEMQSHLDFHLALKISQQQRDQFRSDFKSKTSSLPAKAKKGSSSSKNINSVGQIDKFLTARQKSGSVESNQTDCTAASDTCNECGKTIANDMQEHLDYHAARKLQLELNKSQMRTVMRDGSTERASINVSGTNGLKRKRPVSGNKSHPEKVKSLLSYFDKM